jgi:hypothetical protein
MYVVELFKVLVPVQERYGVAVHFRLTWMVVELGNIFSLLRREAYECVSEEECSCEFGGLQVTA